MGEVMWPLLFRISMTLRQYGPMGIRTTPAPLCQRDLPQKDLRCRLRTTPYDHVGERRLLSAPCIGESVVVRELFVGHVAGSR
jgi:hypothetical protein